MFWLASVAAGERRLEGGRYHRRGHVLEAFETAESLVGLHTHAQRAWPHAAQAAGDAHEGAAGPKPGEEHIERAHRRTNPGGS